MFQNLVFLQSYHFVDKYCRFEIVILKLRYEEFLLIDGYGYRIFDQLVIIFK